MKNKPIEKEQTKYRLEVIETSDSWMTRERAAQMRTYGHMLSNRVENLVYTTENEAVVNLVLNLIEHEKKIKDLEKTISDYRAASEKIMGKV